MSGTAEIKYTVYIYTHQYTHSSVQGDWEGHVGVVQESIGKLVLRALATILFNENIYAMRRSTH